MPLYTLYPCRPDETCGTFVTFELVDDGEANFRALHVLDQHPTASHVVIWCGERKVSTRPRVHDDLKAVLSRRTPAGSQVTDAPDTSELWRMMQIIERNRHEAELLEQRAAATDAREATQWLFMAKQRRELAAQFTRLSAGERPNLLTGLPLPD